jgi:hypothetical protein
LGDSSNVKAVTRLATARAYCAYAVVALVLVGGGRVEAAPPPTDVLRAGEREHGQRQGLETEV